MSKNTPNKPETLTLDDGRVMELKPLKIAVLRRFMERFGHITEMDRPDSLVFMDILTDCSAIALERQLPKETGYLKKAREEGWDKVTEEDREPFAELLDMDEVGRVNSEMGGVSFDDPNLPKETPRETPKADRDEDGTT